MFAERFSRSSGIPGRLLELTDQIFIGYSIYFYTVMYGAFLKNLYSLELTVLIDRNYQNPTVFPSGKIIL